MSLDAKTGAAKAEQDDAALAAAQQEEPGAKAKSEDEQGKSDSDSGSEAGVLGPRSSSKDSSSRTGRFSDAEQKVLVELIKDDDELCRSFLHRIRARQYEKKSWMHEISLRFNKQSSTKRSLDAVRHHFMLRKSGKDSTHSLVWHGLRCRRRSECTKCLLLDRYRVEQGLVRCGISKCKTCKPGLPHVFGSFDAHGLLETLRDGHQPKPAALSPSLPSGLEPHLAAEARSRQDSGLQAQLLMLQRQQLLQQLLNVERQQQEALVDRPGMPLGLLGGLGHDSLLGHDGLLGYTPQVSPAHHGAPLNRSRGFDVEARSKKRNLTDLIGELNRSLGADSLSKKMRTGGPPSPTSALFHHNLHLH